MARARYVVRGTVQGVGFRWFVARQAERLGLHGWTVEVVADGESESLGRLEAALASGPGGAQVTGVEKHDLSHQVDVLNAFTIK